MSALAEALYCHASNVTGIVDRLESRGLVERTPGAEDRRVKTLVLTRKAQWRARVIELLSEPPAVIAALPAADQQARQSRVERWKLPKGVYEAGANEECSPARSGRGLPRSEWNASSNAL